MTQQAPGLAPTSALPTILLVEDEPLIRFNVAEALRDAGVTVVEASTADEAWDYLITGAAADLLFTDHRMPGSMSGAELARRVSQQFPTIKVAVTSAFFDDPQWPHPIFTKPYSVAAVVTVLVALAGAPTKADDTP